MREGDADPSPQQTHKREQKKTNPTNVHPSYSNACTIISCLSTSLTSAAASVSPASYSSHRATRWAPSAPPPATPSPPSTSSRTVAMAARSRRSFSSVLTPSWGVMSPTSASARSCTSASFMACADTAGGSARVAIAIRYMWSDTDSGAGMPERTHPARLVACVRGAAGRAPGGRAPGRLKQQQTQWVRRPSRGAGGGVRGVHPTARQEGSARWPSYATHGDDARHSRRTQRAVRGERSRKGRLPRCLHENKPYDSASCPKDALSVYLEAPAQQHQLQHARRGRAPITAVRHRRCCCRRRRLGRRGCGRRHDEGSRRGQRLTPYGSC